jgi:hypothetical protein
VRRYLGWFLRFYYVMILWNFRNFILFFMCLFCTDLFGFTESYILIEGYISADLQFSVTGNVYPLILRCVTVTNKNALLSGRVQICPLFLRDENKYRAAKYSEMADFWLLSLKHLLECLVLKHLVGTFILHVHCRFRCFCP